VVTLPGKISNNCGINVGGFINVFPQSNREHIGEFKQKKNIFGQNKECMEYKNVYEGISLHCYTTSFGLNTEITIPEYRGEYIFSMRIEQPKGFFVEDETDYVIFRDEEDLRSMMFTSLAVDANNVWNYKNKINLSFDSESVCYISFIIDKDFLEDNKTKYPVTISQSINAYKHKQPDTSVYSRTGDIARHYLSPYMLLGDNTVKGEGWALLRYEVLDEIEIMPDEIISADYYFNNLFDLDKEVIIGTYAITSDWCSVNTRWKSRPEYDSEPLHTTMVKDKGVYGVEVTELLKEMMRSKGQYEPLYSVRNSFFIKSDTENSNLLVASGDSGIQSPYLKIVLKN